MKWRKCRDICEGEDRVKLLRDVYLPKADGMSEQDYSGYLTRAEFFNATGRTLDGLHGLMFRKNVTVEVPKGLEKYLKNVDGKGKSFSRFVSDCTYEALKTNWGGVLLDTPQAPDGMSKKDAEVFGVYPYLSYYNAEQVYNWHYSENGRSKSLDRVCLHEEVERPTADPFSFVNKDQYRLLYINENDEYTQRVEIDGQPIGDDTVPKKSGKPFKKILFWTMPNDEPEKPLLLDLVNTNLAWYRKSADYENGLHWTGVPTPYILGYEPEIKYNEVTGEEIPAKPIYLGGSKVLTIPSGSQFNYLEYNGAGLSQLASAMQSDEERMAILGARIIANEKKGVEAVETARIHRAGENSVLSAYANNLSVLFKDILINYLEWITETEINSDEVTVQISTDYDVSRMSTGEITALVSAWQSGGISKKVLFHNFKEGEVIPNDMTFEDMEDEIEEEKENQQTQFTTPAQPQVNKDENPKDEKMEDVDDEEV